MIATFPRRLIFWLFITVVAGFSSASAQPPTVINVEVDYMYAADHIHRLYPDEVDALVQMFACQGITLNIEISDSIPEQEVMVIWSGFANLKAAHYDHIGIPGWHYCIMGHDYSLGGVVTGSSGYAELPGEDFTVTLGSWQDQVGNPLVRAGTFAHELGHNLGLGHEGGQGSEVTQYKPNYASVMAYTYQVSGVRNSIICNDWMDACHTVPLKSIDYSSGLLPDLNENALDESFGLGLGPIDWNCNGQIDPSPVTCDISSSGGHCCNITSSLGIIKDYDDWSNIEDEAFQKSERDPKRLQSIACMTFREAIEVHAKRVALCDYVSAPLEACVVPSPEDPDADFVRDSCDNCPQVANPDQLDSDLNGVGDVCQCACLCHADPAFCDGVQDVTDVILAINVAFRGAAAIPDQHPNCRFVTTDVNCSASTDVVDVVQMVNVSFRGAPPSTALCNPCL